jgi:hypothetical protein
MKTILTPLAFVAAICLIFLVQGCDQGHDHASEQDDHAALHKTKYNEVLVEFPGHKYAMEIIDEAETTGLVTAFLTDAHFDPITVDAQEVRLNFVMAGSPKTFTLTRTEQQAGEPATFTLTDMELATLICESPVHQLLTWSGVSLNLRLDMIADVTDFWLRGAYGVR